MIDKPFVSELNKLDVLVEYTVKQFKPHGGEIKEEEVYKLRSADFNEILTLRISDGEAWGNVDSDIIRFELQQIMKILEVVEKKIETYGA